MTPDYAVYNYATRSSVSVEVGDRLAVWKATIAFKKLYWAFCSVPLIVPTLLRLTFPKRVKEEDYKNERWKRLYATELRMGKVWAWDSDQRRVTKIPSKRVLKTRLCNVNRSRLNWKKKVKLNHEGRRL